VIALRLALLMLCVPLAGLTLLDLLRCRPIGRASALGMGLAAGLAGTCLALYLPLARDGGLHTGPVSLALLLGAAAQLPRLLTAAPARPRPLYLILTLGLALLVQTVNSAPMRGYDAKAIYGIKAKALHHEGDLLGPVFQNPDVVHYHGDYPLGVPLLMALSGRVVAGAAPDPRGAQPAPDAETWNARHDQIEAYVPVATLWVLGLMALVAGAARRRVRSELGAGLLLLTALPLAMVMPFAVGRSWSWAGADVPLVLLATAAAASACRLLRHPSSGRALLLVLLTAATLTLKNDALLLLLSLGAACVLAGPARGRTHVALALLAGAALGLAPVLLARRFGASAPFDEQWLPALLAATPASLAARLPALLSAVGRTLLERGLAVHIAGLLLLVLPLGLGRPGTSRVLALFTLFHLSGTTLLFLASPNVLAWHVDTALPRLWIHAAGPAALLLVDVLGRLWAAPPVPVPAITPQPE